jgi:hypothetical protein
MTGALLLFCMTWMNPVVEWRVMSLTFPRNRNYSQTTLSMSASSPPPRKPRRMLKKRRRKDDDTKRRFVGSNNFKSPWNNNNKNGNDEDEDDDDDNNNTMITMEYRPLVSSVRRDLGEDYWIDPVDLEKERRQQQIQKQQQKQQRSGKNIIPKEKLWSEVKAPYQQNWIGYFSIFIAILSMIVLKFPELLDTPTITYPDL